MTVRLQLAIDAPEHLALIPRLHPYVDIIEVGTPVLKRFGLAAITTALELGGGREVLADTKTADGGALEAEMVFGAGASMMTVLANASPATWSATREVAERFGTEVVFDTILDPDTDPAPLQVDRGSTSVWLALHASSDLRLSGVEDEDHIARVTRRRHEGFQVSLAGGIRRANLPQVLAVAPEIIVVGSGLTGVAHPEEEARWIRDQIDEAARGN